MFLFYAFLAISAVVFQPLMLVFSFVLRFLWHPPQKHPAFEENPCPELTLSKMKKSRLTTLDRHKLLNNGDAAKFIGIHYWADRSEQAWKYVSDLFDAQQGTFLRRAYMPEGRETEITFSGDMLSGMLAAITDRVLTNKLTDTEKETLRTIWNTCSWSRWPMLVPHQTGVKSFTRGFIWRPWAVWSSASLLSLLVWLRLGWLITHERRYQITYYFVLLTHFPVLWLAQGDGQAFIGKVYALSMHSTHSYALIAATACRLNIACGSTHLRWLVKRYGSTNTDIAVLGHIYTGVKQPIEQLKMMVTQCYMKEQHPNTAQVEEDTQYVDLIWPPKKVVKGALLYPPSHTHHDYCSERSPIAAGNCYGNTAKGWGLDTIFPASLLLRTGEFNEVE